MAGIYGKTQNEIKSVSMKNLLVILFLVVNQPNWAQYPVDHYLELAAANNPGLKARFNDFMASLEVIPQVRAMADPELTFGYFVQPIETRVGAQKARVMLSQQFPWFGTLKAQENVACQVAEAKLIEFQDAKAELFREVRIAYNELYYLKRSIQLIEANLQVLASFKELALINFENGKTGFVSLLRVEMEEKELNTKLDSQKNSQSSAMVAFENLINIRMGQKITLPDSISLKTLAYGKQVFTDSLMAKNRQLQKLKYQSLAGHGQVEVARMMSRPSFNVGFSYILVDRRTDIEVPDNGKNSLLLPEIGMSIPIFQKKYQAMQNQAILEQQSLQYQIEEKVNQLSSEMEYLIRDYLNGQQKIELYEQLTDLANKSISLLQTEFTTGKADFEEILALERKLLTYQLELERAKVDANNAVHNINYLIGDGKF